ncbi:MAG: dihydroorotase [Alphaproteobacteria bacterium]|nr:dihydroorotase [Alphaproteobacteria bacterium]
MTGAPQFTAPYQQQKPGKIAYINARVVDPESGLDTKGAVLTERELIIDVGANLFADGVPEGIDVVDCGGHVLSPGLLDIQVHFREPGEEGKEDLASGSKAAAAGGVTTAVCMANTKPPIDSVHVVEFLKKRARETSFVNIETYATITKGMRGEELSEMGLLKEAGAVGFSDDGLPVMNSRVMRRAMEYAKMFNMPIAQHAEDLTLSHGSCMNEGPTSTKLGLEGVPNAAEAIIVSRDLHLLEITGGHYHVLHISTRQAIEAVRQAKARGLNVTCEAAPHHFALTDQMVGSFRTFAKMNPPLRSQEDCEAVIEGLKDGTIDAIATDHAPHGPAHKRLPFASAAYGIVGLETMLPLALQLYHDGHLSLLDVLGKMTYQAADILKLNAGRIAKGKPADLTLIDLGREWSVDTLQFSSKSKNAPFDAFVVKGRAVRTVVRGKTVFELV